MKISQTIRMFAALMLFGVVPGVGGSQSLTSDAGASTETAIAPSSQSVLIYTRPTHRVMVANYLFDAYGPYPIAGAVLTAGIDQWNNSPPEWKQGAGGFGKRLGSDFATAAAGTTTRYALSEVFREDTLYYRCECRGLLPRTSHAVISTLTARRGQDGHRAFSFAALVAPYAGATTAVYGWYPARFGPKDALRMGSYSLLVSVGENISLEFLYSGPHSLLSRLHMNNTHGAPERGPNR